MSDTPALLIAAFSGRALAEAARTSGYMPLVADFFGDADMRAVAGDSVRMAGDFAAGFQLAELLAGLQALAAGRVVAGLVCGSGFEDRPELLAELARRWPLLGCGAAAVALVKHPLRLAELCAEAGVAHPQTRLDAPENAAGWLRKQAGGSGGGHVGAATDRAGWRSSYFQCLTVGTPVSMFVLACNGEAMVLGTSAQWADPAPDQPYRYGGAVRPAGIAAETIEKMAEAARQLVAAVPGSAGFPARSLRRNIVGSIARETRGISGLEARAPGQAASPPDSVQRHQALAAHCCDGLAGLVSFDFLVEGNQFSLLEINPRSGATLDIFDHPDLMNAHIAACDGMLPDTPLAFPGAKAAAILYCGQDIPAFPRLNWPVWVKDRPNPSTRLQCGAPVCTILAAAAEPHAARRLLAQRIAMIRRQLAEKQQAQREAPG